MRGSFFCPVSDHFGRSRNLPEALLKSNWRTTLDTMRRVRQHAAACEVRRKRNGRAIPERSGSGFFRGAPRGSEAFTVLFREGMALVEETASYLDGDGRQESKALQRNAALAYATESMRLTTRLMQLASWLLLHRAVNEGEMSLAQANNEKAKVRVWSDEGADTEARVMLPETLKGLVDRSIADPGQGAPARFDHSRGSRRGAGDQSGRAADQLPA